MACFGVGPRRLLGGVLLGIFLGSWLGCQQSASDAARGAERDQGASPLCGQDEAREFVCDDLLPLSSSRPAPEPYDNCPGAIDIRPGAYKPIGRIAPFDKAFTAYTRKRVQPGHSCCYSWCAKIELADPGRAAQARCGARNAYADILPESFCLQEPETGTSEPASGPFDRCPIAVKPPQVSAFSAPPSALLDVAETTQKRAQTKLPECCYGWCSKVPAKTMLKAQPKTK